MIMIYFVFFDYFGKSIPYTGHVKINHDEMIDGYILIINNNAINLSERAMQSLPDWLPGTYKAYVAGARPTILSIEPIDEASYS